MRRPLYTTATVSVCVLVLRLGASHPQESVQPLVRVDAIAGIVEAFKTHQLVALPDAHGNAESHAFRLTLIKNSRFADTVDDIVIELGTARHQDLADRYIRGEAVPPTELRKVWQDTTIPTAANNYAMAEELLETVRAVNASRRSGRQLRVLLGEPPIAWEHVRARADHQYYLGLRDSHPAALAVSQVLAKRRKALLMYGALHFQRRNIGSNYSMDAWQAQTIVSLLEAATSTRVFVIWEAEIEQLGEAARSWAYPSLSSVRGTSLGRKDFAIFAGPMGARRSRIVNGKFVPVEPSEFRRIPVEEQIDAVLYLGPRTPSLPPHEVPLALCKQPGFLEEQIRRISLSAPQFEAERLQEHCAKGK